MRYILIDDTTPYEREKAFERFAVKVPGGYLVPEFVVYKNNKTTPTKDTVRTTVLEYINMEGDFTVVVYLEEPEDCRALKPKNVQRLIFKKFLDGTTKESNNKEISVDEMFSTLLDVEGQYEKGLIPYFTVTRFANIFKG